MARTSRSPAARRARGHVAAGAAFVMSVNPLQAKVGASPALTPQVFGGTAPFTLSLASGTLPTGRAIAGNAVTGTYTAAGTFTYTLRVTDAASKTADLTITEVVLA